MRYLSENNYLKEQVLSVDNSKELINLGLKIKKYVFLWRKQLTGWQGEDISQETDYHLNLNSPGHSPVVMGFESFSEYPALTSGEVISLLPKEFIINGNIWSLYITGGQDNYYIEYSDTPLGKPIISVNGDSLLQTGFLALKELLIQNIIITPNYEKPIN